MREGTQNTRLRLYLIKNKEIPDNYSDQNLKIIKAAERKCMQVKHNRTNRARIFRISSFIWNSTNIIMINSNY